MADTTIETYHADLAPEDRETCNVLRAAIHSAFPDAEAKVWHAHPVWLLNSNLMTGYAKLKGGIRLLFWSGQAVAAPDLSPEGKFKGAEARYRAVTDIDMVMLDRWTAGSPRPGRCNGTTRTSSETRGGLTGWVRARRHKSERLVNAHNQAIEITKCAQTVQRGQPQTACPAAQPLDQAHWKL